MTGNGVATNPVSAKKRTNLLDNPIVHLSSTYCIDMYHYLEYYSFVTNHALHAIDRMKKYIFVCAWRNCGTVYIWIYAFSKYSNLYIETSKIWKYEKCEKSDAVFIHLLIFAKNIFWRPAGVAGVWCVVCGQTIVIKVFIILPLERPACDRIFCIPHCQMTPCDAVFENM